MLYCEPTMNTATESTPAALMTDADWTARCRVPYTNPEATAARLASITLTSERFTRACHMLNIARNPGFRFGLTRSDIPAEVITVLETAVTESRAQLLPFAARMRELKSEGFAFDEIWNFLSDEGADEHGLRYGDSLLLLSL
jgi:hypothetical protein